MTWRWPSRGSPWVSRWCIAARPWSVIAGKVQLLAWGTPTTAVVAEALIDRAVEGDLAAAEAVIDRLAAAAADGALVVRDIWLLRVRALLARARGDEATYGDYRERYRTMAIQLDFGGHIALATAMR